MAEYLFTVKDRQTGEILCQGSSKECANYIGCNARYLIKLGKRDCGYDTNTKYSKYKVERKVFGEIKHGGERKKDVICCDCGKIMVNVNAKRKRCTMCASKYANEQRKQYMRERRGLPQDMSSTVGNPNIKGCEGCIYLRGEFDVNKCCNYIFIKGERRPCPPGKECTVKVERKGYREKKERSAGIS